MKARLYKGPFSGKVIEADGRNEIIVTGPKRMSRKAQHEHQRDWWQSHSAHDIYRPPMVRALYRMCTKPVPNMVAIAMQDDNIPYSTNYAVMQLVHPDGSVFYEFVEKRDY